MCYIFKTYQFLNLRIHQRFDEGHQLFHQSICVDDMNLFQSHWMCILQMEEKNHFLFVESSLKEFALNA